MKIFKSIYFVGFVTFLVFNTPISESVVIAQSYEPSKENDDIVYSEIFLVYPSSEPENEYTTNSINGVKASNNNDQLSYLHTLEGNDAFNEIIEIEDFETQALPSGWATLVCKNSNRTIVCDWTGTLIADYIMYSNMHLDWYQDGQWFWQDDFVYPVCTSVKTIRDRAQLSTSFSGEYKMHLNGSLTGRNNVYNLYSYSKKITIP